MRFAFDSFPGVKPPVYPTRYPTGLFPGNDLTASPVLHGLHHDYRLAA